MQAVIDCCVKSYTCYELNPVDWELIRDSCKDVLTLSGLDEYQELFEEEEYLQAQWGAAVEHPPLGVGLLIGQLDDTDIRSMDNEENFHDTGNYNQMKKITSRHTIWYKPTSVSWTNVWMKLSTSSASKCGIGGRWLGDTLPGVRRGTTSSGPRRTCKG